MIPSPNYTDIKFGIHNNAERYSVAAYVLFGLLSSLIGDTLILVATFQKDAFKISMLIVTVIQHIAVANLAISISSFLPIIISLLANSWVLGDAMCYSLYHIHPSSSFHVAHHNAHYSQVHDTEVSSPSSKLVYQKSSPSLQSDLGFLTYHRFCQNGTKQRWWALRL